jgi:hypothetical protein
MHVTDCAGDDTARNLFALCKAKAARVDDHSWPHSSRFISSKGSAAKQVRARVPRFT